MNVTLRRSLVVVTLGIISVVAGWWAVGSAEGGGPVRVEVIDLGPPSPSTTQLPPLPTTPSPTTGASAPTVVPPTVPLPSSTDDDDDADRDDDDADRDDDDDADDRDGD